MFSRYLILVISILSLAACGGSSHSKPDLKRLYEISASNAQQAPLVFVHGAFGSQLRNKHSGEKVWPGGLADLAFGDYASLALKVEPVTLTPKPDDLEAFDLVGSVVARDYYGKLVKTLTEAGGYTRMKLGEAPRGNARRLYLFIYDWRQDITLNARKLGEFIEQIQTDLGNPEQRVDIVAHSLGALITRYYLRFGKQDVLGAEQFTVTGEGARNVNKVIMLGAPNYGSIAGLQNVMVGYKIGINRIPVEVLSSMPSAFQVMPHPDRDWMVDIEGKRYPRDLYRKDDWKALHWGIFDSAVQKRMRGAHSDFVQSGRNPDLLERYFEKYLTRGRRFHRAINAEYPGVRVRYIVFGGDCALTPSRCLVEEIGGRQKLRIHPAQILNPIPGIDYEKLMLAPGDGKVTKSSLLARTSLLNPVISQSAGAFPLAYSMFLCEKHSQLTGNTSFQDNLLNVLLIQ